MRPTSVDVNTSYRRNDVAQVAIGRLVRAPRTVEVPNDENCSGRGRGRGPGRGRRADDDAGAGCSPVTVDGAKSSVNRDDRRDRRLHRERSHGCSQRSSISIDGHQLGNSSKTLAMAGQTGRNRSGLSDRHGRRCPIGRSESGPRPLPPVGGRHLGPRAAHRPVLADVRSPSMPAGRDAATASVTVVARRRRASSLRIMVSGNSLPPTSTKAAGTTGCTTRRRRTDMCGGAADRYGRGRIVV